MFHVSHLKGAIAFLEQAGSMQTIACPANSFCTGGRAIAVCPSGTTSIENSHSHTACHPCPKGQYIHADKAGSNNLSDCVSIWTGRQLSGVTFISDGKKQTPTFKFGGKPGEVGSLNRLYFEFTSNNTTENSITFHQPVTNVEVFAVGGGGAGGKATAYGYYRQASNERTTHAKISAGGGGGAGLLVLKQFFPNVSQTYHVKVGLGGKGTDTPITEDPFWGIDGESGTSTELTSGNTVFVKATGGGGGGQLTGKQGGSGGGSMYYSGPYLANTLDSPDTICTIMNYEYSLNSNTESWYSNTKLSRPSINKQYGCPGLAGFEYPGYTYAGPGGGAYSLGEFCVSIGGQGLSVDITGKLTPYAAGGRGFGYGSTRTRACTAGLGGFAWNETHTVMIGGAAPGGDGFHNSGSGGGSAGAGKTKSGSGADGVLIVAWDPYILPCPMNQFNNGSDESVTCQPCPIGSFTHGEGSTSCSSCAKGFFPNSSSKQCDRCGPQTTCNQPYERKQCTRDGTVLCCGNNTHFLPGISTDCMPCDTRSYAINGENPTCTACPEGSKKSNVLETGYFCECDLSRGVYMHNLSSNECTQCPEDHYCAAQQIATRCHRGTFRPKDSLPIDTCLNCSNPVVSGEYEWNDAGTCTFQCLPGFYKFDTGFGWMCPECTRNTSCKPGSYATPTCAPWDTKDSECVACPAKPPETKWLSVCDFVCSSISKYFNKTERKCNTCSKPKCAAGWNATACTNENDPACERCQNVPLNGQYAWNDGGVCVFACAGAAYFNETNNRTCQACEAGTYRSSNTTCSKCSTAHCAAGTYRTQCNKGETSNSVCASCQNPHGWRFHMDRRM
jgi:hypothetical protein